MTFATNLRAVRVRLNLSQGDLASLLGTSGQTISNWERGRSNPWPRQEADVYRRLLDYVLDPVATVPDKHEYLVDRL